MLIKVNQVMLDLTSLVGDIYSNEEVKPVQQFWHENMLYYGLTEENLRV